MSVSFVRVDDRMIHGQTCTRWSLEYPCDGLIAVNNAAAKNPVLKSAYKSASGKKTFVWSIDEFKEKSPKVLASKDSLALYLQKRNISFSFSGGIIDMTLPSVDYDDIVICDVGEMNQGESWCLRLKGNETSMPGLEFRSGLGFVENIRFTGTVAQSSGDTIGIWCSGNSAMDWVRCSNNQIMNCSFEGLDYGVLTSSTAYCGSITDCSFENCRNGIVLCNRNMEWAAPNCARAEP